MEALLIEEAGYSHMSIPRVHMAERRRYLEGRRLLADIREEESERRASGDDPEQHQRQVGRKQVARQQFAQTGKVA